MMDLSAYLKREFYRTREEEIIKFLESLAHKYSQKIVSCPRLELLGGRIMIPDLFFPDGLKALNVTDSLVIDIKDRLLLSNYKRELEKGKLYTYKNRESQYWVVYTDTDLHISDNKFEDVRFIKFEELKKFSKDSQTYDENKVSESNEKRISRWKPKNQSELIELAPKMLNEAKCSFILGAGVSVDAGSPSWDNLLKSLLKGIKEHNPIGESDYMGINSKCGWSALITARYIISDYISSDNLIGEMRDIIYTRLACDYKKTPTALPIIANITKNCNIENILTFNYDEFVEEALGKIGVKYIPVFEKGARMADEIPVYHIHGLISRNSNNIASYPVLSEREYHRLYSDDFHWSNVELLHALTRNTCLLVGLSMSDPNLRRLLDISRYHDDGEARHFVFMRREPLDTSNPNQGKDEKHKENLEKQFHELGLNIIWFNYDPKDPGDFTDLAIKLEEILNKGLELKAVK